MTAPTTDRRVRVDTPYGAYAALLEDAELGADVAYGLARENSRDGAGVTGRARFAHSGTPQKIATSRAGGAR
jgi:hypothetical protein